MAKSRARKLADLIVGAGIDIDGNLTFDGGSVSADLTFGDNDKANFGDASDLQIFHNGSHSFIKDAGTGDLYIGASNNLALMNSDFSENYLLATTDGAVNLYYDGNKKFETTSGGVKFSGTLTADDNQSILLGTGSDLRIKHDGTNSIIADEGGGDLIFKAYDDFYFKQVTDDADILRLNTGGDATFYANVALNQDNSTLSLGASSDLSIFHDGTDSFIKNDTGQLILRVASVESALVAVPNGAVSLYYDNSAKLATTSSGVDVTGTITADGLTFGTNHRIQGTGGLFIGGSTATVFEVGAGSEEMRLTSTGLGIGTQSPATNLEVAGTTPVIRLTDSRLLDNPSWDNVSLGSVQFYTSDTSSPGARVGAEIEAFADGDSASAPNFNLLFKTATNTGTATEKLRIDKDGRVGIGTTSPVQALDVVGSIQTDTAFRAYDSVGGAYRNVLRYDSGNVRLETGTGSTARELGIWTAGTERIRVDSSGNVGIGTDSPFSPLVVKKNGVNEGTLSFDDENNNAHLTLEGADARVRMQMGTYNNGSFGVYIQGSYDNNASGTGSSGTEPIILNPQGGSVGIGTTSPQQRLDVEAGKLAVRSETADTGSSGVSSAVNNLIHLRMPYGTNPGSAANAGARVGIKFTGRNDGAGYGNDDGKSASIYGVSEDAGAGYARKMGLAFYTSPFDASQSERLRIDADGNVGIGTSSPYGLTHWQDSSTINLIATNTGADGQADTTVMSLIGQARGYSNNIAKLANIDFKTDPNTWYRGVMTFNVAGYDGTDPSRTPIEAMRIDSAGNVGIGTGNTIRAPLQVHNSSTGAGSTEFRISRSVDSSAVNRKIAIIMGTDAANLGSTWKIESESSNGYNDSANLNFIHNAGGSPSTRVTFKANGNVGIGTDSPAVELDLKRTTNAYPLRVGSSGGEGRAIVFADVAGTPTKYNWIAGTQYNVDNGFEITPSTAVGGYTFGTPAFVVRQSGNVGIGTTDPSEKLHVAGSVLFGPAGSYSRSDNGVGINFTSNHAYAANGDPGDSNRYFSITNDSTTANAYAPLSFRVNPNGGSSNAMADIKLVSNGSSHHLTTTIRNPATSTFVDALSIRQDGNVRIGDTDGVYNTSSTSYIPVDTNGRFLTISNDTGAFLNLQSEANTAQQLGGILWTNRTGAADAHRQVAGIDATTVDTTNTFEGGQLRFWTKIAGSANTQPGMIITHNRIVKGNDSEFLGFEDAINILNADPEDGGSDFDQTPTNNSDGGGTTWEISTNGDAIYFSSTSGGHGGTWMKVYCDAGLWAIKGSVRLTNTDGAIHPITSSDNYKFTHSFQFSISSGPDTGALKWDADAAASNTGTDFTRAAFSSTPVYMSGGYKTITYQTNGYNGVQRIYITDLQLVKVG